jgi:hypothetical protein
MNGEPLNTTGPKTIVTHANFHEPSKRFDLRPILPPSERRICEVDFDLMRPVYAKPFSWRIRWA